MRTLAIGDIHGCLTAFDSLIEAVKLQPDDRLITLGDYIDRGPDTKGVLDRLIAMHKTGQLVALRGNHEQIFLKARDSIKHELPWRNNCGGNATLASYSESGNIVKLTDVPKKHWDFLENVCENWYEIDTHFFVHANAHPSMLLAEQPDYKLFWEPFACPKPHFSGKIMVCGHTSQKSGMPLNLGHAICIDTWVYGKGWLTCLDVTSGRVWQANQAGQIRKTRIAQFLSNSLSSFRKSLAG